MNILSKSRIALGILASAVQLSRLLAVDTLYQNDGNITTFDTPPQVDATAFVNNGQMTFSLLNFPFETRNTLNFTNRGIMDVAPGIRFETITHDSKHIPAQTFVAPAGSLTRVRANQLFSGFVFSSAQLGVLQQQFGISLDGFIVATQFNPFQDYQAATLTISADTIDIQGRLQTDIGSSIEISGGNVSLVNAAMFGSPPPATRSGDLDDNLDGMIDHVGAPIGFAVDYGFEIDNAVMDYSTLASPVLDRVSVQTLSGPVIQTNRTAAGTTPFFRYRTVFTQRPAIAPDDQLPRRSIDTLVSPIHSYYVFTNAANPTNQMIRAAFVGTTDPGVLVDIVYEGFPGGTTGFSPLRLLFGTTITNVADGGVDLLALSVDCDFGNNPILANFPLETNPNLIWPSNIVVRRFSPFSIPVTRRDVVTGSFTNILSTTNLIAAMRTVAGASQRVYTNSTFRPNLFTEAWVPANLSLTPVAFTNTSATNPYVGFGFSFRSTPSDTQFLDNSGNTFITNNLGRLSINAKNLNLTRTRVKSEGPIVVKTENLIASTGAALDGPYVALDLGNTNAAGDLKVQGLIRPIFETLLGRVEFFMSTWTNSAIFPDPASTNMPPDMISANVAFQYTVADVSVTKSELTQVINLLLHSKKVTIDDSGTVEGLTAADTEELHFNGGITLSGTATEVANSANFPSLKRLAVGPNGGLATPSLIDFGNGPSGRLESVILAGDLARGGGVLQSSGIRLNSVDIEVGPLAGIQIVRGSLGLTADTLTVTDSATPSSGIRGNGPSAITVKSLSLVRGTIGTANAALQLAVADTFSAPAATGGALVVPLGLQLLHRPPSTDLSGLSIELDVPAYANVTFQWPGEDLGAVLAGFSSPQNLSIKTLVLGGDSFSTIAFSGASGATKNALYVSQIQFLAGAIPVLTNRVITVGPGGTKVTNSVVVPDLSYVPQLLDIPASFTIYFASAITDTGADITDALDGSIPGRLRLVRIPTAPTGLVEVASSNGEKMLVPRSVAQSLTLDSDGDGIVNAWDPHPFDGIRLSVNTVQMAGERMVRLSWTAGSKAKYEVEATSALGNGSWTPVQTVVNTNSASKLIELYDRTPEGSPAKSYRVRYAF